MPTSVTLRAPSSLLGVLGLLLGVMAPALALGSSEPGALAVAVVLAAAALWSTAVLLDLPLTIAGPAYPIGRRAPAYLPARVTDVPRHPLQPRAPGLV